MLTASGFVRPTYDEILADRITEFNAILPAGQVVDEGPDSALYQWLAVQAEKENHWYELLEGIYASQYVDTAEGVNLDGAAQLAGFTRYSDTYSEVLVTISTPSGMAGGTINSPVTVNDTNGGTWIWEPSVPKSYTLGPTDSVTLPFVYQDEIGPFELPVGGIDGQGVIGGNTFDARNNYSATPGRSRETDQQFYSRIKSYGIVAQSGTVDAIEQAVARVRNVSHVRVFENTALVTRDSLPPKSLMVVVENGDNNEIAQAIWNNAPAGIERAGNETGIAIDAQGEQRTINFRRVQEIEIRVYITVYRGEYWDHKDSEFIEDAKQAVLDYAKANIKIGDDIHSSAFVGPVFNLGGVSSVGVRVGPNVPLSYDSFPINPYQRGVFDTSRIEVYLQ